MLPIATAILRGAPKNNACVLCVRVLYNTRRSFIRSFSRLSWDASYLRTGVKGCSKIRHVLAKPRLILDEMCRLYGKFASYLRRVLCKTRLIFPRINGRNVSDAVRRLKICLDESQLRFSPLALCKSLLRPGKHPNGLISNLQYFKNPFRPRSNKILVTSG